MIRLFLAVLFVGSFSWADVATSGTGDVGSVGRGQVLGGSLNYTDCLKAMNEKSLKFKNRIFPLSESGWDFAVRTDEGDIKLYLEDSSAYTLKAPKKNSLRRNRSCEDTTNHKIQGAGASTVTEIYDQVMNADGQKNSFENRKEIVDRCKKVSIPFRGIPPGTGMMMGGPGFPSKGAGSTQ